MDNNFNKLQDVTIRSKLGSIFLIIGAVQFFVIHFIVQSAWTDPQYSWWNNYISDLGAVHQDVIFGNYVNSPLHILMNISL